MTHATLARNRRRAMRTGHVLTWCRDWDGGREGLVALPADARRHDLNDRHAVEGDAR